MNHNDIIIKDFLDYSKSFIRDRKYLESEHSSIDDAEKVSARFWKKAPHRFSLVLTNSECFSPKIMFLFDFINFEIKYNTRFAVNSYKETLSMMGSHFEGCLFAKFLFPLALRFGCKLDKDLFANLEGKKYTKDKSIFEKNENRIYFLYEERIFVACKYSLEMIDCFW